MVLTMVLAIFNACQKDEIVIEDIAIEKFTDPMFQELNNIVFSVENNRLVFESEEDFQKCIDFLANLGDENFPAFEEFIGFESFRKKFENNVEKSSLFVDELYTTMLNPEMEIVIGKHLFRENPLTKQTLAFEVEFSENCELKNHISESSDLIFSWEEEAFAIIRGEEVEPWLKGACKRNDDNKHDFNIQSYTYPPPVQNAPYGYKVEVKSKLNFQVTAIFKSIIAKIKTESFEHAGMIIHGQLFTIKISMNGNYEYDRHRESKRSGTISDYKITNSSQDGISWRPFYGTRRVNCYDINVNFKWEVWSNWSAPQYYGLSENKTLVLQCNANRC